MKTSELKEKIGATTVSVSKGVYTARRSFFYTKGRTAADFAAEVKAAVPGAVIIDFQEVFKAFRGGASVANQSHWWVKFTL